MGTAAALTLSCQARLGGDEKSAVSTEQACLSCHAALDPLASYFTGFAPQSDPTGLERYILYSRFEADSLRVSRPAVYFGVPGSDLSDLGSKIAADPRFASCAVEHIYKGLVGSKPASLSAHDTLTQAFVLDDMVVRDLVRRVVKTAAYRRAEERVLTTEQLATALADSLGQPDFLSDEDGLGPLKWSTQHRVLGGGTDDWLVTIRNRTPGVGLQILLSSEQPHQPIRLKHKPSWVRRESTREGQARVVG